MKNIGNNTVQIEALNSFGLGRRLYNEHAGKLFYVEEKNYWLVWNGKQFICSKIKVEQMARELIENTIRKELDISHRDKITDTLSDVNYFVRSRQLFCPIHLPLIPNINTIIVTLIMS